MEDQKGAEAEREEFQRNNAFFDYDSDLELKKFMVLQQKLEERKQVPLITSQYTSHEHVKQQTTTTSIITCVTASLYGQRHAKRDLWTLQIV